MFRLILSTILLFGLVGCYDEDEGTTYDESCSTLTIDAGLDKSVTVNETVVISGTVTKKDGEISEYEWRKGTEVLSTLTSFSYVPTTVGNEVLTFIVTDDEGCQASDNMTLTVKPVVSSGTDTPTPITTPTPTPTTSTQTNYSWTNDVLKATLTSVKKVGDIITIEATYKNLSDKEITLHILSNYTYLLDENGNRWLFQDDTAEIYYRRTIFPARQISTKMRFKAKDSNSGHNFDLIFNDGYEDYTEYFSHQIQNIVIP